jgi:phage shock protein C
MAQEFRRLYRSRDEARLAGVAAGLGLYFGIDPVIVRLAWVVATCATGFLPGILAYLLAWVVVPREPLPPLAQAAAPRAEPA